MRCARIACRVSPCDGEVESPDREPLRHAEEGDNQRIIQKKWKRATAVSPERASQVGFAKEARREVSGQDANSRVGKRSPRQTPEISFSEFPAQVAAATCGGY